jgi:hypothetical protein
MGGLKIKQLSANVIISIPKRTSNSLTQLNDRLYCNYLKILTAGNVGETQWVVEKHFASVALLSIVDTDTAA